jgi:hypothetical protein
MIVFKELDGAGFAFRGDHRIASVCMQAKWDYTMDLGADCIGYWGVQGVQTWALQFAPPVLTV